MYVFFGLAALGIVMLEIGLIRKDIRHMGERLTQELNDIETAITNLTTAEAAEDADSAAKDQKIADLEAQIADLQSRETVSPEEQARLDGLLQKLADIKAGAQAEAAKRGKKR